VYVSQHILHVRMDLQLRISSLATIEFVLLEDATNRSVDAIYDSKWVWLAGQLVDVLFTQQVGNRKIIAALMHILQLIAHRKFKVDDANDSLRTGVGKHNGKLHESSFGESSLGKEVLIFVLEPYSH
jgi:hypothetical protein